MSWLPLYPPRHGGSGGVAPAPRAGVRVGNGDAGSCLPVTRPRGGEGGADSRPRWAWSSPVKWGRKAASWLKDHVPPQIKNTYYYPGVGARGTPTSPTLGVRWLPLATAEHFPRQAVTCSIQGTPLEALGWLPTALPLPHRGFLWLGPQTRACVCPRTSRACLGRSDRGLSSVPCVKTPRL